MNDTKAIAEKNETRGPECAAAFEKPGLKRVVRIAIVMTLGYAVIVSGIYPLAVWGLAQLFFRDQARGSLIYAADGRTVVGSRLIGQGFAGEKYFHPRPSAAGPGHDPSSSGGTNLGPTSAKLLDGVADDPATADVDESFAGVKQLVERYRKVNGLAANATVPADAVTRSASGVDPHISVANAMLQAARVARVRGMSEAAVRGLVSAHTYGRVLGIIGDPGVNVLELNLALDGQ